MDKKELVTAALFNYNGLRKKVDGKGRLQITIESLVENVPVIQNLRFILVDNESNDGSQEYIENLPFGEKYVFQRGTGGNNWFSTTRNNCENLKKVLKMIKTPYYWNIENDSYFYNKNDFIKKALEVLESNQDISIIHLRRWTPLDCKDRPGAPQNQCRVSEIRSCGDFRFYVIEKIDKKCVWIDVRDGLPDNFKPYSHPDSFKSLLLGNKPGCVRKKDGRWQRLIEDCYATYTTHGYVGRVRDLNFITEYYNPDSEKDFSVAFKKHFKAAKLDEDGFLCFGWNTRINPSEEEILSMFKWVRNNNYSSILDYGTLK